MIDLTPYKAVVMNTFADYQARINDSGTFFTAFRYNEDNLAKWAGKTAYAVKIEVGYDPGSDGVGGTVDDTYIRLDFSGFDLGDFVYLFTYPSGQDSSTSHFDSEPMVLDSQHSYQTDPDFPAGLNYYAYYLILDVPKKMPDLSDLTRGLLVYHQIIPSGGGVTPHQISFTDTGSGIFSLWAVRLTIYISDQTPPLRMRQRNDGLHIQGHARLNQRTASGSSSENTGIRLRSANTYV